MRLGVIGVGPRGSYLAVACIDQGHRIVAHDRARTSSGLASGEADPQLFGPRMPWMRIVRDIDALVIAIPPEPASEIIRYVAAVHDLPMMVCGPIGTTPEAAHAVHDLPGEAPVFVTTLEVFSIAYRHAQQTLRTVAPSSITITAQGPHALWRAFAVLIDLLGPISVEDVVRTGTRTRVVTCRAGPRAVTIMIGAGSASKLLMRAGAVTYEAVDRESSVLVGDNLMVVPWRETVVTTVTEFTAASQRDPQQLLLSVAASEAVEIVERRLAQP